jgi:hypothetical protein
LDLVDGLGQRRRDGRDACGVGRAGGDDDGVGTPRCGVGVDDEAGRCSAHAGDGGVLEDRRVEELAVAVETGDEVGGGEVAVGVVTGVGLAGEPVHPVGGEEPE